MSFTIRTLCLAMVIPTLLIGCGGKDESKVPTAKSVHAAAAKATGSDPYPTFEEGGTLSLTVQGQPVSIAIEFVDLANTDSGYPDYMEISGPGTFLCALIDPKMPDGENEAYYKPIVGRSLPLNVPEELLPTPREISIPNQGKYPVVGGSLTMDKFQIGMDGRDMWEGRIEVIVQTAQGAITLPGTFKFCVVPTW